MLLTNLKDEINGDINCAALREVKVNEEQGYPRTLSGALLAATEQEGFGSSNSTFQKSSLHPPNFVVAKKPQNSYLALRFSRTNLFLVMASAGSSETLRFTLTMGVGWRSASR